MKKKKIFLWLPMVLFVLVLAGGIWSGTVPVRGLREVLSVSAHLGEILANGKKQRQLPIYSAETKDAVVALTFDCAWGTEDLDEVLRVLGELSFRDIGSLFEKGENWACVTYHRARKKIMEQMEGTP